MIDRLLDLRNSPTSPELLGDLENGRHFGADGLISPPSALWQVHYDTVDAALDILVPAIKAVFETGVTGYPNYLDRARVLEILGSPPTSRNVRWRRGPN